MICPACKHTLTAIAVLDLSVTLHVCDGGCAGLWLSRRNLEALTDTWEDVEQVLRVKAAAEPPVIHASGRRCPQCSEQPLRMRLYNKLLKVQIDECWQCGGYWLDQGELIPIREYENSGMARKKAMNELRRSIEKADYDSARRDEVNLYRALRWASLFH